MPHLTVAGVCLVIIGCCGLMLAGYVPGWLRGRSVGRAELAMEAGSAEDRIFWGPEAEDSSWEPEASATTVMPVIPEDTPTVTIPVPDITGMPKAESTVRFQRVPAERRMTDREWLDRQASLGDLVRSMDTVHGRVVPGLPNGTMVCEAPVTAPQPVLDPDTQAFLDDMDRRTTKIIAKFRETVPIPG